MMNGTIDRWAEKVFLSALAEARHGQLTLRLPDATHAYGHGVSPLADMTVHDRRFFTRAIGGGEIGIGDAYMDGLWSSSDLVTLTQFMLGNRDVLAKLPAAVSWLPSAAAVAAHWLRDNTRSGSRRNIHEHYDLGNTFFELFLDRNLMYSCAVYDGPDDSLEAAQINKLRRICDRLDLRPGDRLLEIGTGWGGFAMFAATRYGCHVTTTTISEQQHTYATDRFARAGDVGRRIDLRLEDYRDLRGQFDKIVSIEMFEAVGLAHYDEFFGACDRLLGPGGAMLLQTITVDDWRFREYLESPSWIAKRIFPGAELASVAEILASLARVSRMGLYHAEQIGPHYARTLRHWRERFMARLDDVRAHGFDDRFIRMWELYLAFCEGAFASRHIGNAQLLLTRAESRIELRRERPAHTPSLVGGDDDFGGVVTLGAERQREIVE